MAKPKRNLNTNSAVGVPEGLTHWSVVLAAGGATSPPAAAALQYLCQTYSYPLYAWMRHHGYAHDEAKELIQSFFGRLLERRDLRESERDAGRFRSFLRASLSAYLDSRRQESPTTAREKNKPVISLDHDDAE